MQLLEVSPWEIKFLDQNYFYWDDAKDYLRGIPQEFIENIKEKGIRDPMVVSYFTGFEFRRIIVDNFIREDCFKGLWCWRGTQRLRVARVLKIPKVRVIIFEEDSEHKPDTDAVQMLYTKKIRIQHHPYYKKWDVIDMEDCRANTVIYKGEENTPVIIH